MLFIGGYYTANIHDEPRVPARFYFIARQSSPLAGLEIASPEEHTSLSQNELVSSINFAKIMPDRHHC